MQVGHQTLRTESHKLINSIRNKEELPYQRKEYIIVSIYKKGNKTDCIKFCGTSQQSGARGNVVVKALCYKPEGRRFRYDSR
jgi:hypothetical protein